MSYLSLPRLSFSGRFQADVSTVNNDVRHYANEFFEPRFQEPFQAQDKGSPLQNGWWNPSGTGAFRLVGTKVVQAILAPGKSESRATGFDINAQVEQSAAKLVDLDPQMQTASMIYGMRVVLSDGDTEIMRADYRPSPFRDLFFGRLVGIGNSGGASAKFTSVLTGVSWSDDMPDLEILALLRKASTANGDMLSANFMTTIFGHLGHFLGLLTGSIGTWSTGSPKSFVAGRRFAVAQPGSPATPAGIGFFDGETSEDTAIVSVDLSNALSIAAGDGTLQDIGRLSLAVLKTPDSGSVESGYKAGVAEGATVAENDVVLLGGLDDYAAPGWLEKTAGILDFDVSAEARELLADHPLVLVRAAASEGFKVLIREAVGGVMVRADDFVVRLDACKDGAVTVERTLFAAQWGRPAPGLPITLSLEPRAEGAGGGPDNQDAAPPQAPIPAIGPPKEGEGPAAVTFEQKATTGADGTATVTLFATNPGNPRSYIDGQIYRVNYAADVAGISPQPGLDAIFLHVRDAYDAPEHPDWETDIAPFMRQYDNLYPVMSRNLFSLAEPDVAAQHARLLMFAFERPEDDPNHMPATRDMSAGKRAAVVRWLAAKIPGHPVAAAAPPRVVSTAQMPGPAPIGRLAALSNDVIDAALARLEDGTDGKTHAMRDFLNSQRTT